MRRSQSSRSVSLSSCCLINVPPVRVYGRQHYNRSYRYTTLGLVDAGRLRADFAFAAIQQSRNVGAVHEPQQNGEQQKQRRDIGQAEIPDGERRKRARDERGE